MYFDRWNECKNKPHYYEMFLSEAGQKRNRFPKSKPGTKLKQLLELFWFVKSEDCNCNKHIAEMNNNGPDWCDENMDTIVGWLREESGNRKILFSEFIARRLIKLAIARSKK